MSGQWERFEGNTRDTVCIVLHSLFTAIHEEVWKVKRSLHTCGNPTPYIISRANGFACRRKAWASLCLYEQWWVEGVSLGTNGKFIGMMKTTRIGQLIFWQGLKERFYLSIENSIAKKFISKCHELFIQKYYVLWSCNTWHFTTWT